MLTLEQVRTRSPGTFNPHPKALSVEPYHSHVTDEKSENKPEASAQSLARGQAPAEVEHRSPWLLQPVP